MGIRMLGIDHKKASIEEREIFSFTKKKGGGCFTKIKSDRRD